MDTRGPEMKQLESKRNKKCAKELVKNHESSRKRNFEEK
jgi:hypothetical protein